MKKYRDPAVKARKATKMMIGIIFGKTLFYAFLYTPFEYLHTISCSMDKLPELMDHSRRTLVTVPKWENFKFPRKQGMIVDQILESRRFHFSRWSNSGKSTDLSAETGRMIATAQRSCAPK